MYVFKIQSHDYVTVHGVPSNAGGFATPRSEQDALHTPPPTVGQPCAAIHQSGRGASAKGRHVTPMGLGCEFTHLLPCLQGIHSRQHGFNTSQHNVRNKTSTACDILFGTHPDQEWPTIDHVANLVDIYTTATIMPADTWSWPVTGWKRGTMAISTGG
jgi:hypothetical protein